MADTLPVTTDDARSGRAPSSPARPGDQPTEAERAEDLRRMKAVAAGLLVAAAVVFVLARLREGEGAWAGWGYVRATAEAAMVGALADWFAVTALFRHPLRIPIPHTAIVRRRKDQIGAALGGFVESNFLTREVVGERLKGAGLARRLGQWLATPGHAEMVGDQTAAAVRGITEVLSDEAIQQGLEGLVVDRAQQVPVAPVVGRAVDVAIEGGHHQALVNTALETIVAFLAENAGSLRNRLTQESPWWVPDMVDDAVFERIYSSVHRFLAEVAADPNHELRLSIDERAVRLADDLKRSPEMIARGEELKAELLAHHEFRSWTAGLWGGAKAAILEGAEDPQSTLRVRLDEALATAGRSLQEDEELQAKVDAWIVDALGYVAEQVRGEVAGLISSTVQRWDADETSDRIELQVGRDLQFIRINGTLVGGLAGLLIYTVSELLLS